MRRPAVAPVVLALAVILVILVLAARREAAPRSVFRVLVARRALPAGYPLQLTDLGTIPVAELGEGALTDQELHLIRGARLRSNCAEGETIRADMLALSARVVGIGRSVPRGMRAYQMLVPSGLLVQSGDVVDVLSVPSDESAPAVLAEGVEVIDSRAGRARRLVILALPREALLSVEKAAQRGKLTVVLRNPDDRSRRNVKRQIRRRGGRANPHRVPRIEIIAEE